MTWTKIGKIIKYTPFRVQNSIILLNIYPIGYIFLVNQNSLAWSNHCVIFSSSIAKDATSAS